MKAALWKPATPWMWAVAGAVLGLVFLCIVLANHLTGFSLAPVALAVVGGAIFGLLMCAVAALISVLFDATSK